MGYRNYEYDYHDLAADSDFIEQEEYYTDDEPWMDLDNETADQTSWENSYHNLANDIDD